MQHIKQNKSKSPILLQIMNVIKKGRVEKTTNIISNHHNIPAPNIYIHCTGKYLMSLLWDKIQYHEMRKRKNIHAVKNKLIARNLQC